MDSESHEAWSVIMGINYSYTVHCLFRTTYKLENLRRLVLGYLDNAFCSYYVFLLFDDDIFAHIFCDSLCPDFLQNETVHLFSDFSFHKMLLAFWAIPEVGRISRYFINMFFSV